MDSRGKYLIAVMLLLVVLLVEPGVIPPSQAQMVLTVINLGQDGGGVVVNPNTNRVYVAVAGQLNVYNAQTHALITTIPLPQNYTPCYDLAINTATNRIYAVGFRTYVVDANTNTVLVHFDKQGREVVVNPTTNRIYIAGMVSYPYTAPYAVYVLNGATNAWLPDINLGTVSSFEFTYLAVNPVSNRIYIAFTGDDDLRVLDGNSHAEVARVHLENIGSVVVNPATNRVYVTANYVDAIILDATSHTQVGVIPRIGGGRLLLNQQTNRLYSVWSASPGYVLRIADLASNAVVGYVYLDGDWEDYAVHEGLGKVFGTHDMSPSSWAKKMSVIQDASPSSPAPMPPPPCIIATLTLPEDGDGIAVNTVTGRLYVGVDGGLAVFDVTTLAPLPFINLSSGGYAPPIYDIGINENLNRIYAVSVGQTYVINGANNQVIGNLGGGDEIAVNSSNGRVYIADDAVWRGDPDRLRIYDGVSLAHIRTINLGTSIYFQSSHVAVNPATGYAYCTYSLDDDLRIISPSTDNVIQTIDYSSIGTVAVNPTTNRVYVWVSRSGQSGALILDGNTHAELGMIAGLSGQLRTNTQTNRVYGYTGWTLFQIADAATGLLVGRVFLDGDIEQYAVHSGLSRLYVTHSDYPAEWGRKVSVIQDSGGPPPPTPTATLTPTVTPTYTPTGTPTRTPTRTATPTFVMPTTWLYLPVIRKN
ncbi:MAG: YncE family protein [Chloroflexi bacterium]|nr:YncE family protein [Chloroflexota bacterium]